jgi:hypothetical protein
MTKRSAMAEMVPEQETHTFRVRPLGHLFGGILMVATAVILAVVIGVQTSQSIVFRALFGLGCFLYAWWGERLARVRVQVHGSQLIVHNYVRTRTVNASDIQEITWDWWRYRVVPRVHLAGGGSFRLAGLWSYGSHRAEVLTIVEEILSLLGVHVPIEEQIPGQLPDQASAPDSSSGLPDQSTAGPPTIGDVNDKAAFVAPAKSPGGLPSESVGVPRPPRNFRKGLRTWLPIVLGLALGVLYCVSATVRALVIVLYVVLAFVNFIRFIAVPRRRSRTPRSNRQNLTTVGKR